MQSAALVPRETPVRPLDRDQIDRLMNKYKTITEASDKGKGGAGDHRYFKRRVITHTMKMKLTAKFELAIKDAYRYRRQMLQSHSHHPAPTTQSSKAAAQTSKSEPPTAQTQVESKEAATPRKEGTPRKESVLHKDGSIMLKDKDKAGKDKHSADKHHKGKDKDKDTKEKHLAEKSSDKDKSDASHPHGITIDTTLDAVGDMASGAGPDDDQPLHRPVSTGKSPTRIKLTTRQLLPYYTLDDVTNFMDTFSKVDEDFSGDLDIVEWVRLFNSMNHHMSEHDARMIFMKLDKNGDGYLTMRELIPVIFSRASRPQQKLITEFASFELIKKQDGIVTMTLVEMEQLFEMYDTNHIGYVAVRAIRDHVNKMTLPEPPLFMFLDTICHAGEDEMVNLSEFIRLLKLYVEKSV
jgi:Ca2+-binding EF-hand superfamily protein